MNKYGIKVAFIIGLILFLAYGCKKGGKSISPGAVSDNTEQTSSKDALATGDSSRGNATGETDPKKRALLEAYPDLIKDISENEVVFVDGTTIVYDDGKEKDFETMLDNSDVEDMFYVAYQLPNEAPEYLQDAGRSRSESLFKKMYGTSESAVRKNLTNVDWFGQNVTFTKVNGAADSLRAVAKEIANHPDLKPYLKSSGTFYWRTVRGANRLSAHSYGIAFDIAVDKADYWQWKAGTNNELAKIKYANKIPRKLVEIFQSHGFIWGGAWYHYDTMHFEFRPEILNYSRNI